MLPSFKAGQRITAAEILSRQPMYARKSTDTTVSASTTFVEDPDIQVTLEPNSIYLTKCHIWYTGSTAGDISVSWFVPSGASTGTRFDFGPSTSNTNPTAGAMRASANNWNTALSYGANSSSSVTLPAITEYGTITTGASGGVLQLRYAQVTASGTLTVKAGSFLTVDRIG